LSTRKSRPKANEPFAKFGTIKREKYLQRLAEGGRRYATAKEVGVSAELVRLYRKAFPEFSVAEEQAEMQANEQVEDALFQAAISGNVTAAQVWLYNRDPQRWKDQRNNKHELSGGIRLEIVEEIVDAANRPAAPGAAALPAQ